LTKYTSCVIVIIKMVKATKERIEELDGILSTTKEGREALYEADCNNRRQVVRLLNYDNFWEVVMMGLDNVRWLSDRAHDDLRDGWVAERQLGLYGVPASDEVRDWLWTQGGERWHHIKVRGEGLVRERFFRLGDLVSFAARDPQALDI